MKGFRSVSLILASAFTTLSAAPGFAAQDVTVGIAANFSAMSDSTSNPYANYFRDAIHMALAENKALLASKGITVHLKEFDYGDDKLKVIETANAAVKSDALAVLGYIYSSDALLAGPILNKNGLLLLTPTATADRLETIGRFVRRTCFDDSYQGKILAEYAWKTQKVRSIGIIYAADCAYCNSLRTAFKERFERLGGKIVVEQTVLSNDADFSEAVAALKGKSLDAVFVPNYERVAATIISQLLDAGVNPRLWLGGDGWGNSVDLFYRIVGSRKFTAYAISHWHAQLKTPQSKLFTSEFVRRYGKPPVDTAVLAYDAARLLIQGLTSAKKLDRLGLIEAVEQVRTFEGVTGKLAYPPLGRTPIKPGVLLRLQNNNHDRRSSVERVIGG
jgi:branched-chain amino acid transport system substrate-binding protein